MTDSDSSEEDLSRFKEAVDTSFNVQKYTNNNEAKSENNSKERKPKSKRYLEIATHYNDVKVPRELQNKIGKKISSIIEQSVEFVTVEPKKHKRKIKGGVKLFKDSEDFLSCHEAEDTFTESHNINAKKLKENNNYQDIDDEKFKSVVVTGEYVISKEEIKCWKSRRKEKVFKYKSKGNGVLVLIE